MGTVADSVRDLWCPKAIVSNGALLPASLIAAAGSVVHAHVVECALTPLHVPSWSVWFLFHAYNYVTLPAPEQPTYKYLTAAPTNQRLKFIPVPLALRCQLCL